MQHAALADDMTYLEVWRQFGNNLSNDQLWSLAERLILDDIHNEPPRVRNGAQMAVWGEVITRGAGRVATPDRLIPLVELALTRSVPLAADLYYFWASADPRYDTVTTSDRDAVGSAIYHKALANVADPEVLMRCLHKVEFDGPNWLSELLLPSDDAGRPASRYRETSLIGGSWPLIGGGSPAGAGRCRAASCKARGHS